MFRSIHKTVKDVQNALKQFDKSGNGAIDKSELTNTLSSTGGNFTNRKNLHNFRGCWCKWKCEIAYEEFIAHMCSSASDIVENFRAKYKNLNDVNLPLKDLTRLVMVPSKEVSLIMLLKALAILILMLRLMQFSALKILRGMVKVLLRNSWLLWVPLPLALYIESAGASKILMMWKQLLRKLALTIMVFSVKRRWWLIHKNMMLKRLKRFLSLGIWMVMVILILRNLLAFSVPWQASIACSLHFILEVLEHKKCE